MYDTDLLKYNAAEMRQNYCNSVDVMRQNYCNDDTVMTQNYYHSCVALIATPLCCFDCNNHINVITQNHCNNVVSLMTHNY